MFFLVYFQLQESSAACERHIQEVLSSARNSLHTAQELSLIRHGIVDEQAVLADELTYNGDSVEGKAKQSLLRDLEELHERLGELERARTYVRVIERTLRLRYVFFIFFLFTIFIIKFFLTL